MLNVVVFLVSLGVRAIRAMCRRRADLVLENVALRQQVTALKKERPRPPLEDTEPGFLGCSSRFVARVGEPPAHRPRGHRSPLASRPIPTVLGKYLAAPPSRSRLVKKFVRHFDRVARPEYGLTRPCYTNYSGSTRLRVIADQYRNRPTILRLPKMNTASRRPDRPQNQNESSVPSRYRTRLSANAAKKSIELQ